MDGLDIICCWVDLMTIVKENYEFVVGKSFVIVKRGQI